ncbi:MAG: BamA/TamA family outer membrane protein [Saprospiraceae bacterium]|nr:BamA/TamA family outer membrane protein [Saprospiraceae bacterium]
MRYALFAACLLMLLPTGVSAQYFGRNKPKYETQDFQVTETEHFDIHQYIENPEILDDLIAYSEMWYDMHAQVLRNHIPGKNPMIVYNNHADFQQSTVISGSISVGTGGVTEGLRNRVVFPIAFTNQQTSHVLGHELVHAFQYNMVLNGDSTSMQNLANLPLWMIEGLAEYMSIGNVDPHTALWMRDAVINDDIPGFRQLNNMSKYFPYRWGQAFWAFIAGVYGDEVVPDLFMNTAKYGFENAVVLTLRAHPDSLSNAWQRSIRNYYGRYVKKGAKEDVPGKKLLTDENAGTLNVCPVLSPNGKYVIFLTEKSLFTTDLYLADARNGKLIRKVSSALRDGHIDQFNYIESAGTWSPDSKRFAFDAYEKGRSILVIKDVESGKTVDKFHIEGVPSFSNPAWSPDGKTIVVSGQVGGQVDLFAVDIKTQKVQRLTENRFSEVLPAFSPDGTRLVFSTDELSILGGRTNGVWTLNLAVLDMVSNRVEHINVFPGADNLNPQYTNEGNIVFLSNRDGFRNLYHYNPDTRELLQLTKLNTGITGITPYAPAITVAENRDRILFTYFNNREYQIFSARRENFTATPVDPNDVNMAAGTLPPLDRPEKDIVTQNLRSQDRILSAVRADLQKNTRPYKPQFALSYAGASTGVGVATGNTSFGAAVGLAGGVDLLFDDMLGNNQIYLGLAVNGNLADMGGQFSYLNQKSRTNWGINLSHIPFRTGQNITDNSPGWESSSDSSLVYFGYKDFLILQRQFQERVAPFLFFPLSVTKRFEVGGAFEYYHQQVDVYSYFYDELGNYIGQERERLSGDDVSDLNVTLWSLNAAFVGDNSYFGLTAPLQGWRYRIGVDQNFGDYQFTSLLLDGRRYFYFKPAALALRGLSMIRFGGNQDNLDVVYPLYAGQSFFVRGYDSDVLSVDPTLAERMLGSKIAVVNAELRLPLFGPRRLAVIPNNFLMADFNVFFDAGVGWFTSDDLGTEDPDPNDGIDHLQHEPVMSVGFSFRVNLFGAIILEPFWAVPLSAPKEFRNLNFGMNIVPGW